MGVCDDGDDPAPRAQTRSPRARVDGSHHDLVTLVVPGGASVEAQLDLVGVCASSLAGPGKLRGEYRGLRGEERAVSLRRLRGRIVPNCDHKNYQCPYKGKMI
jgi:hypothetical protein